ncbi:FGGY family carbohydrate kinase [Maritimibacter alkaliphilus]|uniref:FGGY family carbohydrate kinase n=1 Tax=Maritimibacter alkaliphilus TaxID=404236 RepID=UPI001C983179|nr:FGGY family carbohydrate kinase [Maritimibacter alkaliphilus]MBY6089416.1 carbohydrate kinase [Maritimibacter alkaliphilus]
MTRLLICLDSGTTAVKAAAFDLAGHLLASAERPNTALRREGARVEQDMEASRDLAMAVLRDVAAQAQGRPEGLILTGQGDGLWPVDAEGRPVGNAFTWLDGRARALAAAMAPALDAIEAVTGARPTAAAQSLQLLWLQQNAPERFARIAHALRLKDWLFYTLTGTLLAEPTAALPVWGSWRSGETSRLVQEALGLTRGVELQPAFAPVGEARAALSPAAAAITGLPAGLPVLLGPGDVQSTLIGLGLGTRPEVTRASVFGTSAIHACLLDDPDTMPEAPRGAMVQKYVLGEGYLCFHPCFNGATVLAHLGGVFRDPATPHEPAYSPLILHPFLEPGGERAPWTDPEASGALFGLTAATTPAQIAWAGREALAFVACTSHAMMGAPGGALSLGGGLARDAAFARFLATCTGVPVLRSPTAHAGPRGLAAIAATHLLDAGQEDIALHWIGPAEERLMPDTGPVADYAQGKYAAFRQLIDTTRPHWAVLSDLAAKAAPLHDKEYA